MSGSNREWLKKRAELIKEAVSEGRLSMDNGYPEGNCKDCKHWHPLTPDHKIKRSQGGSHDKSNIDWICNFPGCMCHDKRDNQGDPMKKKPKSKKADWSKPHKCKKCKVEVSMLLCPHCKNVSV